MKRSANKEEFEKIINATMGEWKMLLVNHNARAHTTHLSCKAESGMNYLYHVVSCGTERILTYDHIEALEVYKSIKG